MPTAAFANLGCKVNQYETDKLIDSFVEHGFTIEDFNSPADVYVINSCSVTGAADRKSRHMARKAARQKDGAKVVLTGCFAQLALDTNEIVDGAHLLVPNREKMRLAEITLNSFPEIVGYTTSPANPRGRIAVFPEQAGLVAIDSIARPKRHAHTRATIKVQDGCQHFCAFCSIPYTRNTMASRSLEAIIAEASQLASQGVFELVVTGVCVGAYFDEASGAKLPELMQAVANVPGIRRVRLSSLQPIETDDQLIEVMVANPNICPHMHLSLQSGDDTVLKAMQRPYDTVYYRDLVQRLRSKLQGIAITTDIIVGFPGETETLFENTVEFAREIGFSRAHIFRYSPRERTYAHRELRDDVDSVDKERRHKILSEVCLQTQIEFTQKLVGQQVDVLVEGRGKSAGMLAGYTDTYVRVHFPADGVDSRSIIKCKIESVTEDGDAVANVILSPSRSIDSGMR